MLTNVEVERTLNAFEPRPYQLPILKALDSGFKRVLAIMPRRSGKDVTALNYVIRKMWERPGVYYYIFPTYAQAKKVIWDSITNDGRKILDYFPADLILSTNSQEMKISMRTRCGHESLFQLIGSDNYDSLMGSNPRGCVFSEYALQDPMAFQFIGPILTANEGWALFISTPRGKNHLYQLYEMATRSPHWFVMKLSLDDTKHIPLAEVERERADGLMSEDLIQQEYYTSFDMGVEGSYYSRYVDRMRMEGRISAVPWENGFAVHTAWDLGMRDYTAIIFFQTIGQTVRFIDCYQNSKHGLEHYAQILAEKPYVYGTHIAPHDIQVKELGTGITRLEKSRQLGIKFTVADYVSVADGIEAVRSLLGKVWMDDKKCELLLACIESYRQEYDHKKKVYRPRPLHDWSSHYCFTSETKVITFRGNIKIRDVGEEDLVWTLNGWREPTKAERTAKGREVDRVTFEDFTWVECTPEHEFLTTKGWVMAVNLYPGLEVMALHPSPSHGKKEYSYTDDLVEVSNLKPMSFKKVASVEPLNRKRDVWCFGVDGGHFCLANGAVVHNCDALRYLAVSLPKTADGTSPEDLDKRFMQAAFGQDSTLPTIFQTTPGPPGHSPGIRRH